MYLSLTARFSMTFEMSEHEIEKTRMRDQNISLEIAALGGLPTRDKRGNVLDNLWSKYSEESKVGMLLETNDVRTILLEQIRDQLKSRRDLIQEIEDNALVCTWLMDFTKSWEECYQKQIMAQFDIGQSVLCVMNEAYFEVLPFIRYIKPEMNFESFLCENIKVAILRVKDEADLAKTELGKYELELNKLIVQFTSDKQAIESDMDLEEDVRADDMNKIKTKHETDKDAINEKIDSSQRKSQLKCHEDRNAVTRLLFRHPSTGPLMCRIAGSILRKQDVCNRSGGYSATRQRNDITQQKDIALDGFCAWLSPPGDDSYLNEDSRKKFIDDITDPLTLARYIIDHKNTEYVSKYKHYGN